MRVARNRAAAAVRASTVRNSGNSDDIDHNYKGVRSGIGNEATNGANDDHNNNDNTSDYYGHYYS